MGLDQYLFLVGPGPKDPQELITEDGLFDAEKARQSHYTWRSYDNRAELDDMEIDDIRDLITVVEASERDFDLEAIRREAGSDPAAKISGQMWGPMLKSWSFSDGTHIEYEGEKEPPSRLFRRMFLVWKCEDLAYWRKDFLLDDELARIYGNEILNLGWHKVSPAMYEAICASRPSDCKEGWDAIDLDALGEEALVYHIWY